MKLLKSLMTLFLVSSIFTNATAQIPFSNGRIAISSDGNAHDGDDWGATPLTLMILAKAGLQDKVVLYTYSDHIWGNKSNNSVQQMRTSINGSKTRWNYNNTNFIEAVNNKEAAYNAMRDQINASSANNPLTIICAGPMHVVGTGMSRARAAARQFVTLISHSNWNNRHSDNPTLSEEASHSGWTWDEMKNSFGNANFIRIKDQNSPNSVTAGFNTAKTNNQWAPWNWMDTSADESIRWAYSRIRAVGRADASDGGMAFYLVRNDQNGNPAKLKNFIGNSILGGGTTPPPPGNSDEFYIVNRQTGKKLRITNTNNGSKLSLGDANSTDANHRWTRINTNNNYFYLKNANSGMYFRPENNNSGSKLIQRPTNFSGNFTQWKQVNSNNGYFYLQNRSSGKYFRPQNNNNNTDIQQVDITLTSNWTQWQFVNVGTNRSAEDQKNSSLANDDLQIFPNPSQGTINLKMENTVENMKVRLSDIRGRIWYTKSFNSNETSININNLSKGIYLLQVNTPKYGTQTKRVIFQ